MKTHIRILIILGIAVSSTWANCWWTGCQPTDWAVRGCEQYGMSQRGNRGCRDGRGVQGDEYQCCPSGGGGGQGGRGRGRGGGGRAGGGTRREGGGGGGGGGAAFVTYDQFRQAVTSNGFPAPSQEQYNNFNTYARQQGRISTTEEAAMALAQFLHESDGLRARREYACAQSQCPNEYRDARCDRPGSYYFGRGYIQLSWCYNYGPASQAIFGDDRLLENPDLVAQDDRLAWQTAFWFWGERVHNQAGVQQGRFGASTRAINGGLECSAPGNAQAQARFRLYGNVRRAFGLQGAGTLKWMCLNNVNFYSNHYLNA
ncbi:unnamed protein product [Orchesella dallaii]|uniref:Glycoside hydrolase family 19 catalytic domain-containing protein n=1 Tax=Orchesella dallaii TaxID=48710 RepID=A0ABP1RIC3_9HEXA